MADIYIANLTADDLAAFKKLQKDLPLAAPLAAREVLRAGIQALQGEDVDCLDCASKEAQITLLESDLCDAEADLARAKREQLPADAVHLEDLDRENLAFGD